MSPTKSKSYKNKRSDVVKHLCPEHGRKLVPQKTRWGMMLKCIQPGCTVVCWPGSTSTPANNETRAARTLAHSALDPIWESGVVSRTSLYKRLSEYMGIKRSKTHIGMFSYRQCMMVVDFCMRVKEEIESGKTVDFTVVVGCPEKFS